MTQDNKFIRSLIESAKRGNNSSKERLFEISLDKVYQLSFLLTCDKSSADYITTHTLISAWNYTNSIDNEISFAEWIKKVAIYVTLNKLKKNNKADEPKKLSDLKLIEKFSSASVAREYLKLSDTNKFILTLNLIEDYSAEAISKLLNLEVEDIMQRITDFIKVVIDRSDEKPSVDTVLKKIGNLRCDIKPDENLLQSVLDKIYDIKIEDWEKEDKKRFESEILKYGKEQKGKKEKREKKTKPKLDRIRFKKEKPKLKLYKKFLIYLFLTAVIAISVYYYYSDTTKWKVIVRSGTLQINNNIITGSTDFNAGDKIQTNDTSAAILEIPDIGTIAVRPNSTIERLDYKYSAKLTSGKIVVNTDGAKDFLTIITSRSIVNEFNLGSNYVLESDENGYSKIEVIDGWLQVVVNKSEIIFPHDYILITFKRTGACLPYHKSSSNDYISLLEKYMFGQQNNETLDKITESSSEKDGITLWNLLRVVKPEQRHAVYDKLYELFPHPVEIEREDILNLDENELYRWLEKIR